MRKCFEGDCGEPCWLAAKRCQRHHYEHVAALVAARSERADRRFDSSYEVDSAGCWVWVRRRHASGYGQFDIGPTAMVAHVFAWVRENGQVPLGTELDHFRCERRECCNPEHVRPASHRENTLRGRSFAAWLLAKTHCKHGHEFTPENAYFIPSTGGRQCKTCVRRRVNEHRARQRAAGLRVT